MEDRKHPARFSTVEIGNRSTILFLTVCAKDRKRVLANDEMHETLVRIWSESGHWQVGRYVIMPDHIHLFCGPLEWPPSPVRKWAAYWKNMVAREFDEGVLWQRDVWDRQLRSGDSYSAKWEYVRNNPVRHGLVKCADDWMYQGELSVFRWHDV